MAIAETARLIASLELKDNLSKGVGSAITNVGRLESKVGGLQSRLGKFSSNLSGGVSRSLSTFTGRLKGAATAGLGLLGIGGLFALGSAFKSTMEKAREFGDASIRLAALTGLNIETSSRLVDALDFYGVTAEKATKVAGMFEKNVGNLTKTKEAAIKFETDYGLKIRDSSGATLDFNKQLLKSADFFNDKSIPASKKAAALSKLYGRSWQDLIPVLALGRKGIEKAQKDAISLSQADLDAIVKNKEATRKWNDAIGDLQVKIGIGLMPTITELVTSLTGWVNTHGPEIQQFIRDSVVAIKGIAGTAIGVVSGIKSVWDGIPDPVKDILVKGLIADRTVKFLFGFSITGLVTDLAGGMVKGLGSALVQAGIGKAFVQPVFVTNMGAGGPGGMTPGAPGGGGGIPLFLAGLVPGIVAIITSELAAEANKHPERTRLGVEGELKATTGLDLNAFTNLLVFAEAIPKIIDDLQNPPKPLPLDPRNLSEGNKEVVDAVATSRDRIEAMRIENATKLGAVRSAIDPNNRNAIAAQRTGDRDVIAAMGRNKPHIDLTVNVSSTSRVSVYQTGGTLNRTGPSGVFGPGHGS